MDLYILNPDTFLMDGNPIDEFESLIWTERYSDSGEVTLVVPSTQANRATFVEGMFLYTPASKEVALVESVADQDGLLTITGPFLVDFLKQRILRDTWSGVNTAWKLTGTAGDMAATIVREMCLAGGKITSSVLPGTYGSYEVIPKLSIGASPSGDSFTHAVPYGNVYDGVKEVCGLRNLGFTLQPVNVGDGTGNIIFYTYQGRDLTSSQSLYPAVIFDPALDSLEGVSQLRSLAGYKTAAYAFTSGTTGQTQVGSWFVSGSSTLTGWKRRSLMVDASGIDVTKYTSAELMAALNYQAWNALVNNNYVRLTDGQIVPQNAFKYGLDYSLGDIVELRDESTISTKARITEYIRAQDSNGETAYPTLAVIG